MRISIQTPGLHEFKRKLERLPVHLKLEILRATHQTGKHLVKSVKRRFKQQGPGWRPLNPVYRDWRKRVGLGSSTMMRTMRLYNSIHFVRSSYTGGFVGIRDSHYPPLKSTLPPWKKRRYRRFPKSVFKLRREQLPVATVAKIHEHGLGRTPRRAFFGPTVVSSQRTVRKIYLRALIRALKK